MPSAPGDIVYGIARIDSSGRICERGVITALGWAGGDQVLLAALPDQGSLAAYSLAVVDQAIRAHGSFQHVQGGRPRPPHPGCPGTLRAYSSYWKRTVEQWGGRRLDEPTPSEIKQLAVCVKANAVPRRNSRGGHNAAENLISALRCLYRRAVDDGLIGERDNPARKVPKPRRLPSTRRALDDARLAEISSARSARPVPPARHDRPAPGRGRRPRQRRSPQRSAHLYGGHEPDRRARGAAPRQYGQPPAATSANYRMEAAPADLPGRRSPNILRSSRGSIIWVTRSDRPVLRLATAGLRVRSPDQANIRFHRSPEGQARCTADGAGRLANVQ